ncbi:MAG: Dam family site-specific DNA-(adenine-N6)-methyltransferase [Bacteroidota bacterium]
MQTELASKDIQLRGKPFLKWAGGKTQLLSSLAPLIPDKYDKYIEPFIGGGALYFHLNPTQSIIADLNEELIVTYIQVRDKVEDLIIKLKDFKNTEEDYYKIRALEPTSLSEMERAARFIYLNKTCFNGLYRVNKKGKFNVPYGKRSKVVFDEERLRNASKILAGTKILHANYIEVLRDQVSKGDFIFLDPPYFPVGKFSDFKRYTKEFFYEQDHIELRNKFAELVEKGCYVLLTNSNHPSILELYKDFEIIEVSTKRLINRNASNRKGVDIIVVGK